MRTMLNRMRAVPSAGTAALVLALGLGLPRAGMGQQRPALLVLVTVDQLRADYIARFDAQLTGGFRRLADESAYFVTALQDHAMTSTAPGHATLWSGRFPRSTNIVSNDLGVPDAAYPLIGGYRGPGASPRRFRGSTLIDWLVAADSTTRVVSVSRKDRGAILPVGASREAVYWWSKDGAFTTSTYYAETLPPWLQSWNARTAATDWLRRAWDLLLPPQRYPEPDTVPSEGVFRQRGSVFPRRPRNIAELERFPLMDSLTLDVALTGARALGLGRDGATDVLAVSLSTLDAIGHDFGPDSREVHDHFLRLDRWLGDFLNSLERELGSRELLLVVSSDHGITTMPELLAAQGLDAGRVPLQAAVNTIMEPLQRRHRTDFGVLVQDGLVLADTAALRARGIEVPELAARLAAAVSRLGGIERVFTPATLAAAAEADPAAGLWRRSIPPAYGWLIAAEPRPNWSVTEDPEAEHGTPDRLNLEVPLFFHGPRVGRQRVNRVVRTVDVAPTIAALPGIAPTETTDGVILRELVH